MKRALILFSSLWAAFGAVASPSILHRGNLAEAQTLDLQKYSLTIEAEIVRDLFMGLLTIDAKGSPVPGLAESWTVSPDGRVYTFKLRPNLVWSDGAPLTAADAVFGLQRGLDPKTESWYATQIFNIVNAEAVYRGRMPMSQLGVKALDARTVEIRLNQPSPAILLYLSFTPMTYPAPKHLIEKNPNGWARPGVMVSSGPYVLGAWRVSDTIRLDKNPRFFDAANVRIDQVFYYPTIDDTAALNRFRAGELDLNLRFAPTQISWLRQNLPAETKIAPSLSITYLVPNLKNPKFSDVRVRRALSLAIDRATIVEKVLRNGELASCGFVPATMPGYASGCALDASPLSARQTEARRLLAEAGYGPDAPLRFTFMHRAGQLNRIVAVALSNFWKQAGVEVELLQSDVAVHYNKLREGDFELADAGWTGNADPELYTYLLLSGSTEVNYGGYASPEFDRATRAAESIYERAPRMAAFAAAEAIALKDQAIIPIFVPVNRALVRPYVKGFQINALHSYPTRLLRLEGRQ